MHVISLVSRQRQDVSVQQKGSDLTWPLSQARPVHPFPQLQKGRSQLLRATDGCWLTAVVFLYGSLLWSSPAIWMDMSLGMTVGSEDSKRSCRFVSILSLLPQLAVMN